jgi:uncharacterized protein
MNDEALLIKTNCHQVATVGRGRGRRYLRSVMMSVIVDPGTCDASRRAIPVADMTLQTIEPITDDSGDQSVRGFLHRPGTPNGDGVVLTHGAGGNSQSPLLVALGDLFSAEGLTVLRCDLPFRQLRPKGPPSPSSSIRDQAGLRSAVATLRRLAAGHVFLGGQSYGGRQASVLVASDPNLVSGLLLLSYPLHPPGRSAQLRTAHFPSLNTPTLFVSGTKDAFGSIEEMESAIKLIPAPTRLVQVTDAGHSLLTKQNRDDLPKTIVTAFDRMFRPNRA